jgi:plasmid stability protein
MTLKQIAVRVDEATAEQLKLRAAIEHRSVSDVVSEAIREYLKSHPISRERMLEIAQEIVKEDAALIEAMGDA